MKNWIIALSILILPMAVYFAMEKTHNTTGFSAQAANKPVILKFYSPMCLDCKKLDAVAEQVLPKYTDKVTYEKINAQVNDGRVQDLIKKYSVVVVPTCVFLKKDGSLYKRTEGFIEAPQFENLVKGLING